MARHKQSFRPGAINPIRHNRGVRLRKALTRSTLKIKALRRDFERLGQAAEKVAGATQKLGRQLSYFDEATRHERNHDHERPHH